MKLENKRLAQERRAMERKKKARNEKLLKVGKVLLVILVIAAVIGLIWLGVKNLDNSADTANDYVSSEEAEDEVSYVLNTDSSLTAKDGDKVSIDYIGYVDDVEFTGGNTQGTGVDLELGSGMYIDGFEDQIVGHKPGETFDINVTFPEGYSDTTSVDGDTIELSNADAVFKCTLNGIYEESKE